MKKFMRKALASMLVFTMCFSSANISAFAQNVDEIDTTTEVVIEQTTDDTIEETTSVDESISESETDAEPTTISDNSGWDQTTKEKIFEGENFKVYFTLSSNWDAGYNATIKLENTGDESIQNWYLGFEYADSITNIWNAEISSNENGYYTIKNVGWNQNIAVGQSIEFGITSNEGFSGFPLKYELLGQISNVDIGDYNINYILANDWETGFSSTITINNDSDTDFEDWVLEFDFDRNITEIWNGIIEKHEGNHYVVKNATYNANIVAGQSVSFGFNGNEGSLEDAPKSYLLYSYKLYDGKSMEIDTDNDGLVDGVENLLGLNYKEKDSDGDGLDDYFEYSLCGLNPLEKDTDGDGVLDGDEDCDKDELSNALESYYNTDPLVKDTDNDGLNDYEEVITYLTNPLCIDTDEDELSDYDDVKLGFSPLNKDSDDDGTIDSQEIVKQTYEQVILDSEKKAVTKVSLDMSTNGNIENTCAISNTYNIDKMSSDVVGLVGVPVEINCSSNFEKATITFWYDKDELGDVDEKDLAVMWHDVDNHCYRLLDEESIVNTENGTVSYVTTHFSTYMLVDRNKWYDAWKQNLDYRTSVSDKNMFYDFAFVIDVSGSMSGARISTAKEALKGFVQQLGSEDEACLVKFNSYASAVSDFTSDQNALNNAVTSLRASGGTNVNAGLLKALELYDKQESNDKKKIIVLICDGDVNYNESTIKRCIENDISIYTVNVGAKYSDTYLKTMSEKTSGEYYYCTSTSDIEEALGVIQGKTIEDIDTTDTDGDGLFDVYETVGVRLENGKIIHTDPNLKDTDGDGLTDYEEVGLVYSVDLNIGSLLSIKGKYVLMYSDPLLVDTDSDGIIDSKDDKPWTYNSVKNLLIYQSSRPKGLNADGSVAADMKYGQTTRSDILNINKQFKYQLEEADSENWGANKLFSEFEDMSTSLFSTGKMENVIKNMILHFKEGSGSDYSNATLTQEAYKHKSTQKYINDIKGEVIRRLKNNGGNIYDLEFTEEGNQSGKSIYNWAQQNVSYPRFHENSDIIHGLTICVNDTWGNTVEVKDYNFDGEHFSGTLHFCIYDHFGLDQPDVEKTYVNLAGFRAWYVLQHYDYFNGSFVPFVTLMEFDVPFESDIIMFKTGK